MRSNTATLEGKSAHTQSKHKETEERCTQLQQRVTKLMTREKEFITSHEKDIQKASELNKKLRQQLEEKYKEAAENTRNFNLEVRYQNMFHGSFIYGKIETLYCIKGTRTFFFSL